MKLTAQKIRLRTAGFVAALTLTACGSSYDAEWDAPSGEETADTEIVESDNNAGGLQESEAEGFIETDFDNGDSDWVEATKLGVSDITVVEEMAGARRLRVTPRARGDFFGHSDSAAEADVDDTQETEVVVVQTFRGLLNAGLPDWLVAEVLDEQGLSVDEVTEGILDLPIPQEVIDLAVLEEVGQVVEDSAQRGDDASPGGSRNLNLFNGAFGPSSGCGGKWTSSRKSLRNVPINGFEHNLYKDTKGSLTATLDVDINTKGRLNATINYETRSNKCGSRKLPYRARFVSADFDVVLETDGAQTLSGDARYSDHQKLFADKLNLWHKSWSWWVYFFYIELDVDLDLEYGVDLQTEIKTSFSSSYAIDGKLDARWECDPDGCEKTRDRSNLDLKTTRENEFEIMADVAVIPWSDLSVTGEVTLYKVAEIGHAKLGVAAAVPIRYYGYYGNRCGDGNGDGKNESVRASLFDVSAEAYGYLSYETASLSGEHFFPVNIPGFERVKKSRPSVWHNSAKAKNAMVVKNLFFRDFLSDGSSVLSSPVIVSKTLGNRNTRIDLESRSCYPFDAAPIYEVNWGDGSPVDRGTEDSLRHTYAKLGTVPVSAKIVGDTAGRDFTSNQGTRKNLKVAVPKPAPTPSRDLSGLPWNARCFVLFGRPC